MPYVLIVDDEPDSSEFVERFLRREGYKTACVPNGREALAALIRTSLEDVTVITGVDWCPELARSWRERLGRLLEAVEQLPALSSSSGGSLAEVL